MSEPGPPERTGQPVPGSPALSCLKGKGDSFIGQLYKEINGDLDINDDLALIF